MESVIIPVSQGGFVAASLWQRHKAKALVIVHPATAVVQGFYKGFAEYLYKREFSVITYDYRGTGLSKSGRVRHNKNTMSDWIEQDVGCITAWAKARAPGLTLLAIGHSIGGHAVLLSSASTDLRAAVMVASHAGVTSTISQTKEKLRVWCLLRVLGPALCRLFGYMPARRLGLGEDLPAPAMLQWGRWSAMPEYFYDDPEWDARQRAGKITLPILVLGFDDDPWANTEAISRLLAPAQNAKIERREIRRADYGLSSIGHMGFFRTRNAEKLWPLVAQWLERHCPDKRRTT
ncbi:alpha/beta fold hydrolase [Klebsiella pneumoniae]|uniref:alpha/beta hydrolase family protein n=1 Tax=Klebsiella pneumoniae TaxID=573 RepID=UPI001C53280F|nr:alpha/beta fold hydrolase [Klebsiella pneumoniae]